MYFFFSFKPPKRYSVRIVWKIFSELNEDLSNYEVGQGLLFNVKTGRSLFHEIGGNLNSSFYPLVLEPTSVFYNAIRPEQIAGGLEGKKFPFRGKIDTSFGPIDSSLECNFGIHVYGKQVCLSIHCKPIEIHSNVDLLSLQDLSRHASLNDLAKRIISIVITGDRHAPKLNAKLKVYPCMQVVGEEGTPDISHQELVSLVTRHSCANIDLVNSICKKNHQLQVDNGVLLLDRQGIISFVPTLASVKVKEGNERRFRSSVAMLELSAATKRLLDDSHSLERHVFDEISQLISQPRQKIPNSTSALLAWGLLVEEFGLVGALSDQKRKITSQSAAIPSNEPFVSVLCFAAAEVEVFAIRETLQREFLEEVVVHLDELRDDYALKYIDPASSTIWYLVGSSFQGQTEIASILPNFIAKLKPTLILMVGMCMGMPKKELLVGTVVVPNEVVTFDHQRLTDKGIQFRPHEIRVDNGFYKLARLVANTPSRDFSVIADKGLASSSAKVESVKNSLIQEIETAFPDVIAYDMEGWGFYRSGMKEQCLWVKAVADCGEPQQHNQLGQEEKRRTQLKVTANAIGFAIEVVRQYSKSRLN